MSNEAQEPDITPDAKPERAPSPDGRSQLDKENRERYGEIWQGLVMPFLQWVINLTVIQLLKLFSVIAFAGVIWWLIHGGR